MSIASSLSALQTAKTDIAAAITQKGGTVASGDGMSDFAADILGIPAGTFSKAELITYTPAAQVNVSSVSFPHTLGVVPDGFLAVAESGIATYAGSLVRATYLSTWGDTPLVMSRIYTQDNGDGTYSHYELSQRSPASKSSLTIDSVTLILNDTTFKFQAGKTYKIVIFKW